MSAPPQPNHRESIADKDGKPTTAYIKFFAKFTSALQGQLDGLAAAVASILALEGTTGNLAATKADKATTFTGAGSIIGGGDLSSDKTLSLLNDADAPGADMVYGTDAGGLKGWKADPTGAAYTDADARAAVVIDSIADSDVDHAPSRNAVFDALALKADLTGGTFSGDVSVPDEAYDATAWNGSLEVPTKNAVRDKIESLSTGSATAGYQINEAITVSTTVATNSSTAIPLDNTIPQSGEGDAYASLDTTINVQEATSDLVGFVKLNVSASGLIAVSAAVFRDAGANAIAGDFISVTNNNYTHQLIIPFKVAAGSTGNTTFKVRWGRGSGSGYINRTSGIAAVFGGVLESVMEVREVKR